MTYLSITLKFATNRLIQNEICNVIKLSLLLFTLSVSMLNTAQPTQNSRTREIVFKIFSVVPMDVNRVLLDQVLVIKNVAITSIGKKAALS
jgi:hypothetical protein